MRKSIIYAVPIALVTLVAQDASAQLFFDDVAQIRQQTPSGDDFNSRLAAEYKELTLFEADDMYDWIDAENHATKANMAIAGNTPMPSEPENWGIEDPAKLAELQAARSEMMTLFGRDARTVAPAEAARAQAMYDCWVEQQEEGHQPDHIAACKDRFHAALDALRTAMEPVETAVVTVQEEVAREIVYFDFDQATITPAAQTKIDAFVAKMRQIQPVTLFIEGHTDTSGASEYNLALSAERSLAVRDELVRQGMTVGDYEALKVESEGESRPAVATGDGVREPLNRRVEIIARGEVVKSANQ